MQEQGANVNFYISMHQLFEKWGYTARDAYKKSTYCDQNKG